MVRSHYLTRTKCSSPLFISYHVYHCKVNSWKTPNPREDGFSGITVSWTGTVHNKLPKRLIAVMTVCYCRMKIKAVAVAFCPFPWRWCTPQKRKTEKHWMLGRWAIQPQDLYCLSSPRFWYSWEDSVYPVRLSTRCGPKLTVEQDRDHCRHWRQREWERDGERERWGGGEAGERVVKYV